MTLITDVMKELNITDDTPLALLIEKYHNLSTVKQSEINNIKKISVMPLANHVQGQADNVKERMFGIVADEKDGSISVMNKRYVLLQLINDRMNNKLNNVEETNDNQTQNINLLKDGVEINAGKINEVDTKTNKRIDTLDSKVNSIEKPVSISLNSIHDICKSKYKEDQVNE